MKIAKFENWTNLILGSWLLATPWIFSYDITSSAASAATWNAWLVGFAIITCAGLAIQVLKPWEEWSNLILGSWLFISPWALGYTTESGLFWNSLVVGSAVAAFSAVALPKAQSHQQLQA
jgi:hypothetical protein